MQVVTRQSWFGRIGKSFAGVIFGFIMSLVAFPLLFINEGRAVKTAKALQEGSQSVVSVSNEAVDAGNDGKFVHFSGHAHCEQEIADEAFGVSATAIRLHRDVEMFQWKEHSKSESRKRTGGGMETVTTYSYSKEWSDSPINSNSFHESGHNNPSDMPIRSSTEYASDVTVGAYHLPYDLVKQIHADQPLKIDANNVTPELAGNVVQDGSNGLYWSRGGTTSSPAIGDLRVRFTATYPTDVSVLASQQGNTVSPYETSNGRELYFLSMGNVSAADMIAEQERNNRILTWVLRLVGTALMAIGFFLVVRPLSVFADVIPILGTFVGAASGFVTTLIAIAFSLATISLGWVTYRPLIGIPLLAASVGLMYLAFRRSRNQPNHGSSQASSPPPVAAAAPTPPPLPE